MSTPLPPAGNVIKVIVSGNVTAGFGWANIFYFEYAGSAPEPVDCGNIAEDILNAWADNLIPLCPPNTILEKVEVIDLSSEDAASGEFVSATPGTSTASHLPANAACLVSKEIVRRYRGGRPRTYLFVGADENLEDEAHWNSAFVTTVNDAYTSWLAEWTADVSDATGPFGEVCVSYYGGAPTVDGKSVRRVTPLVQTILADSYSADAQIASQRGRIGRRR